MKNVRSNQSNQKWKILQLGITLGLTALFLAALLYGMQGMSPVHADPGTLYVDGATGQDIFTCGTVSVPCQTISYTLNSRAESDDTIRVAQDVYTENLTVDKQVTLEGGYVPSGTLWLTRTGETVIDGSSSQPVIGDWDGYVYASAVITDDSVFKMWYTGIDFYGIGRVGCATSTNGITWTRLVSPVLDPGNPGDWDEARVGQVSVLKNGPLYQMWFVGWDNDAIGQVGYATSTNGVDWTKYAGNPVLTVDPGAWDETEVGGPRVVFDGSTYHLWYHGFSGGCCDSIGYATSPDGINWTKHPNNPVFGPGLSGDWDDGVIYGTDVLTHSGQLHMWYTGVRAGWVSRGIGYITSTNGVTWTRFLTEPVLDAGAPGTWDEKHVSWPTVVKTDGLLHMWYRGSGSAGEALGYATSSDGISWTKSASNPVFSPGTPGQWGEPVVRFEDGSDGAVLDGFTVTGGDTDSGGGLWIEDDLGITVRNSTITSNTAHYDGGGIWVGQNSELALETSIVSDNTANGWGGGGIIVKAGATLVVSETLITGNVVGDTGGGINVHQGNNIVRIYDSVIQGNHAINGNAGGIWAGEGAYLELVNDIIAKNESWDCCAGMQIYRSSAWVMNTTVVSNSTTTGGGGNGFFIDFNDESDWFVTMTNSILWDNVPGDFGTYRLGTSTYTITYSDIGDGFVPGPGNISGDPLFVDMANGDYHLQPDSPCVDTGTNAGAPDHDWESDPRPMDGDLDGTPVVDIGADEFKQYQIFLPLTLKNVGA